MARPPKIVTQSQSSAVTKAQSFELLPTTLKHIFLLDIQDNGQLREVAVMKKWENGSVSYIDVGLLDNIDRGRMKDIVTGMHKDNYELYELMFQKKLSNGINALEYFNQLTKHKLTPGSNTSALGGSLSGVRAEKSSNMVGAEFTDPTSGVLDSSPV